MGQCRPGGTLARCPERPYDPDNPTADAYCWGWHRILVPAHQPSAFEGEDGLTLTQFILEAAPFQRGGYHGWLPGAAVADVPGS